MIFSMRFSYTKYADRCVPTTRCPRLPGWHAVFWRKENTKLCAGLHPPDHLDVIQGMNRRVPKFAPDMSRIYENLFLRPLLQVRHVGDIALDVLVDGKARALPNLLEQWVFGPTPQRNLRLLALALDTGTSKPQVAERWRVAVTHLEILHPDVNETGFFNLRRL